MNARHPLALSLLLHGSILIGGLGIWALSRAKFSVRKVEFEVLQFPQAAPQNLQLQPSKPQPVPPPPAEKPRAVFGASRKSITADNGRAGAEIKLGNTVAKEQDDLTLDPNDADALPIPADEFLVTQMPRLRSEVRIPYPEEAKKAGVEGPVVMDLLIDKAGRVRKVDLVKGPGFGLNEAAVQALQKFEFLPGQVGGDAVAVKIRYTYRFVLETR